MALMHKFRYRTYETSILLDEEVSNEIPANGMSLKSTARNEGNKFIVCVVEKIMSILTNTSFTLMLFNIIERYRRWKCIL